MLAKKALSGELRVQTPRKGFDFEEINGRDKMIRELAGKEEAAKKKKKCPSCGSECEETYRCAKCGREVCDECGTFCAAHEELSSEAAEKSGYYCSECW